ncbi:MAG TPA: ABC transporter permease [Vicinamibacterales bacterium]|nr:ABC transporter permease [Vicinamibacterales bacterium]
MTRFRVEFRHAWRALAGRPVVSLTVVASLGLGLGLAMLTFTLVDAILLRPLKFARAQELLLIYSDFRPESGYNYDRFAMSAPEVLDYTSQNRTVHVAAYQPEGVAFADGVIAPEQLPAVRATSGVFRILETPPLLGRTLTTADDQPGAACAVVLSYGLWQERFAGDPGVIGKRPRVNGEACEVAGVMPSSFFFPTEAARLWLPLSVDPDPDTRGNHGLMAVGRLRSGMSLAAAREDLSTLMTRWVRDFPHHKGHSIVISPFRDELVFRVEQQLLVLGGAGVLVLLTIAANMSGLLLAHGEARRREVAVRGALGAARGSLVRQLMMEGWLLAALGGLAGGIVAWLSIGPILQAYPLRLPRATEVQFDLRTAGIGMLASLAIGTLVTVLPALRLTRGWSDALRSGERAGQSLGLRSQRVLVVSELAIGVAVSVAALLLVQSFVRLQRVPLGWDPVGVTGAIVGLPGGPGRGPAYARQFFEDLEARLDAQPGVVAAGGITPVPFVGSPPPDNFTVEGRPVARPSDPGFNAGYVMITPGAFEALRIGLVRGRLIDGRDRAGMPVVAVINETVARTYWSNEDPLGKRIRYPEGVKDGEWSAWGPWITIVGIVKDTRVINPAQLPRPMIYVPHAQLPRPFYNGRTMGMLVRADQAIDPAKTLRRIVGELDTTASLSSIRTMDDLAGAAVAQPRFMGWIMAIFAGIALLVAALGVYGVVAYGVARRTREIGVRLALGASRRSIAELIGRQTVKMTVMGLALGLGGAAGLAWWLRSLLFEVQPFAIPVYAGVCVILVIAIALATVLPARRATRVDPLIALRTE